MPQGSILGPLLFLICIRDLPKEIKSNVKHFADDMSHFTRDKDKNESTNIINNKLLQISKWVYNWKMLFNPDPNKPAQEVLFSRKNKVQVHPTIYVNNIQVERTSYQKHLGFLLDKKLNLKQHIDSVMPKVRKGISVIKNLRNHC